MNPAIYSSAMTGARTATHHHHHTHETKECTFVCDSCRREFHKTISVEKDCPTVCTTCSCEDANALCVIGITIFISFVVTIIIKRFEDF